jgi:hypothetical protein
MINKKVVIIIGIVLLAAGAAYAAGVVFFGGNAHGDISDGLVLDIDLTQDNYVTGTKTFADDTGYGNNGVSTNAATFTTDKYGKSTGAMSFNGVSDVVNAGSAASLNIVGAVTMEAWIKLNAYSAYPSIINKWNGDGYILSLDSDGKGIRVYIDPGYTFSTAGDYIGLNQWYHVVGTWGGNGTSIKIYVDGDLKEQSPTFSGGGPVAQTLQISGVTGGFSYFNGSMSGVKVWNRELSLVEVQALYNSSKLSASSSESGLVGHWVLDEDNYDSATNRVTDKSAYENHGINVGANFTTDRMGHSNGAMFFNGTNSNYVNVSYSFGRPNNLSISVWFKTSSNSNGILFDQHDSVYPPTGPSAIIPVLWVIPNGSVRMEFYTGAVGAVYSSKNVSDNNWHHAVAVGNTSIQYLYVDGVFVASRSGTLQQSWWNRSTIGTGWAGGREGHPNVWRYFNGSIADVRVYNRSLSATEVKTLYDSYNPKFASGSLQTGLVLDMPLTSDWTKTEVAGSQIMTDKTPYANDGQNYGATVGISNTSFDGINDYVNASNNSIFSFSDNFTLNAWINPLSASPTNWGGIITKDDESGSTTHRNYFFGQKQITDELCFFWHTSVGTNYGICTNNANLTANNWFNVVAVVNKLYLNIYVNGINQTLNVTVPYGPGSNYVTSFQIDNSVPVIIGRSRPVIHPFNGSIAGVKIYNRALSDSEIKLLYARGR